MHDLRRQKQLRGGGPGPGKPDLIINSTQISLPPHTLRTDPVRNNPFRNNHLARLKPRNTRPHRLDDTGPLMPRNKRISHISRVDNSVEQLKIGPANANKRRSSNNRAVTRDQRRG